MFVDNSSIMEYDIGVDYKYQEVLNKRGLQQMQQFLMKDGGKRLKTNIKQKEKSPSIVKIAPVPEFITCPKCGGEIELWSDEYLTVCLFCGHKAFKKEDIIH